MDVTQAGEGTPCPLCRGDHAPGACVRSDGTVPLQAFPEPLPDPLIGTMVGSFRIQRVLGHGGMGTVYLAEHPVIGSKVAIKFLHESMCGNAELVGRFYDEARAVNLIGHENIVAIYDLALLPPSRYFIVMEYLEGAQLSDLLRAGPLRPPVAVEVLLQLADALQAAHDRGVIHRDLKPENVFLLRRHGSEHFVKLVDFGIAKLAGRGTSSPTAAGVIVGTPEFMAPEQCEHGQVDRRTDVYALGTMAYNMLTGRLPFGGSGVTEIMLAQLRQAPRPLRELDPSVPAPLERVILRALAKRPADRWQDMAAFADALQAARREGARAAQPVTTPELGTLQAIPAAELAPRDPELEVRVGAAAPRRLRATQITRGGLFLCDDGPLPPLFTTVHLRLPIPGGAPAELRAEVVRHVSGADAARWRMAPGFAVQLGVLDPTQRRALEAIGGDAGTPVPRAAGGTAAGALARLEGGAAGGPYELLGVPPDASFPDIRAAARALRTELEALRPRLPADQAARVPELVARVDSAVGVLGDPAERLMFDARRGNFQGVAQCVTAGAAADVIAARRHTLLRERPERGDQARRHLARAQVAAKLGNRRAALSEYEAALTADPLDLDAHRSYWELRRLDGGNT